VSEPERRKGLATVKRCRLWSERFKVETQTVENVLLVTSQVKSDCTEAKAAIARAKRLGREAEAEKAGRPADGGEHAPLGISTHKRTRSADKPEIAPQSEPVAAPAWMGVELYPEGARVHALTIPGNPTGKGGGKRGEIQEWSTASRRRMREYLLTHSLGEGLHCLGLTLTIPGPGFDGPGIKKLWHAFSERWRRAGGCAVWRREVQARGTDHWHCLGGLSGDRETVVQRAEAEWLGCLTAQGHVDFGGYHVRKETMGGQCPDVVVSEPGENTQPADIEPSGDWGFVGRVASLKQAEDGDWQIARLEHWGGGQSVRVRGVDASVVGRDVVWSGRINHTRIQGAGSEYWAEVIEDIRCHEQLPGWSSGWTGVAVRGYPDLAKWPGAEENACDAELQEKSGAWLRYLQDHATKRKQAQVLKAGAGRHWGKIQAKGFEVAEPIGRIDFGQDHEAMGRFLRQFDRLRTPKCTKAQHDGKRRYAVRSSRTGRRVYFSNPVTIERLARWAISSESIGDGGSEVKVARSLWEVLFGRSSGEGGRVSGAHERERRATGSSGSEGRPFLRERRATVPEGAKGDHPFSK